MPAAIISIISSGDSLLELSEVKNIFVAYFSAIAPIFGLLPLSLSPPHPKTK